MRSRVNALLVCLLTALGTVLGLTLGLPAIAGAATAPAVGQCHNLTLADVGQPTDTKQPVPCNRVHDAQTVAVVSLPSMAGQAYADLAPAAAKACYPQVTRALGRTSPRRAQTGYTFFYFFPTQAEIDAGAHWVRCDVALLHARSFARSKKRLPHPIVPRRLTDKVRGCLTHAYLRTTCDQAHAYRSLKAFTMAGTAYPTKDQFTAAAGRRCNRRTDLASWPYEYEWSLGNHAVVCYEKTRK